MARRGCAGHRIDKATTGHAWHSKGEEKRSIALHSNGNEPNCIVKQTKPYFLPQKTQHIYTILKEDSPL